MAPAFARFARFAGFGGEVRGGDGRGGEGAGELAVGEASEDAGFGEVTWFLEDWSGCLVNFERWKVGVMEAYVWDEWQRGSIG